MATTDVQIVVYKSYLHFVLKKKSLSPNGYYMPLSEAPSQNQLIFWGFIQIVFSQGRLLKKLQKNQITYLYANQVKDLIKVI